MVVDVAYIGLPATLWLGTMLALVGVMVALVVKGRPDIRLLCLGMALCGFAAAIVVWIARSIVSV